LRKFCNTEAFSTRASLGPRCSGRSGRVPASRPVQVVARPR